MSQSTRHIGKNKRRSAFSMIELVIVVVIIGIIAAIAIPRMSRGSAAAADSAVASNLAILRNAIDLYQTEHQGLFPTAGTGITVEDLLTKYSNIDGTAVASAKNTATGIVYGPYIRAIPSLSVGDRKGKNGMASADAATIGWIYDATTGTVAPNAITKTTDENGKAYSAY